MRMPGFNAEGALDRTNARYHTGRLYGAWTASQRVSPQLPKSIGFCMSGCDAQFEWGTVDNAYCKAQCFDDGNGGGGGGNGGGGDGGGGDLVCGPCNKRTGLQRCVLPGKGATWVRCGLAD